MGGQPLQATIPWREHGEGAIVFIDGFLDASALWDDGISLPASVELFKAGKPDMKFALKGR